MKWLVSVRHDHRVHSSAFRVAHALSELAGRDNAILVNRRRLCAVAGLHHQAIQAALGRLQDRGYITVSGHSQELEITILTADLRNRPRQVSSERFDKFRMQVASTHDAYIQAPEVDLERVAFLAQNK